jgi:cholesterol oxidase
MLGAVTYPKVLASDAVMPEVAEQMGVGDTFTRRPVGVFFGRPGEQVADPYFGGCGPRRSGCLDCGECMTGCRHNAKNTLVKNYLYLAEQAGAVVHPLTTVRTVRPLPTAATRCSPARRTAGAGGGAVHRRAGGVLGERAGNGPAAAPMRDEGVLPRISSRLGVLTRTNSESILGAIAPKGGTTDYTRGVAITSSFHPDAVTHVEPVRYGRAPTCWGCCRPC